MTAAITTPTKPANPEEHTSWCEHALPESLIRLSENPINGVYETDGSGTDLLWCAITCALSAPVDTLNEALALVEGSEDIAAKLRLAIAQIHQIDIDASNIRFVHEEGLTDEARIRRNRKLDEAREVRYGSPAELNGRLNEPSPARVASDALARIESKHPRLALAAVEYFAAMADAMSGEKEIEA